MADFSRISRSLNFVDFADFFKSAKIKSREILCPRKLVTAKISTIKVHFCSKLDHIWLFGAKSFSDSQTPMEHNEITHEPRHPFNSILTFLF